MLLPMLGIITMFLSMLQLYITDRFSSYFIGQGVQNISYAVAGHRAVCSTLPKGCIIDAKALCMATTFPTVRCTWYGGVDASHVIRWQTLVSSVVSKGHFILESGTYKVKIVLSHWGASDVRQT